MNKITYKRVKNKNFNNLSLNKQKKSFKQIAEQNNNIYIVDNEHKQ